MTDLIKLAERVEALDGRDDYSLRSEIATALGWRKEQVGGVFAWYSPDESDIMKAGPPKWLTSLDAAVSLAGDSVRHIEWCDGFVEAAVLTDSITASARAATPALALTAAMLYAQGERSKT